MSLAQIPNAICVLRILLVVPLVFALFGGAGVFFLFFVLGLGRVLLRAARLGVFREAAPRNDFHEQLAGLVDTLQIGVPPEPRMA